MIMILSAKKLLKVNKKSIIDVMYQSCAIQSQKCLKKKKVQENKRNQNWTIKIQTISSPKTPTKMQSTQLFKLIPTIRTIVIKNPLFEGGEFNHNRLNPRNPTQDIFKSSHS